MKISNVFSIQNCGKKIYYIHDKNAFEMGEGVEYLKRKGKMKQGLGQMRGDGMKMVQKRKGQNNLGQILKMMMRKKGMAH